MEAGLCWTLLGDRLAGDAERLSGFPKTDLARVDLARVDTPGDKSVAAKSVLKKTKISPKPI